MPPPINAPSTACARSSRSLLKLDSGEPSDLFDSTAAGSLGQSYTFALGKEIAASKKNRCGGGERTPERKFED